LYIIIGGYLLNNVEHLFISYAGEDWYFAEWLTRSLTATGYRVWCDRFKLLGGESYPRDIDKAIKVGTFRLIAVLSKSSIDKPNPVKERTLAMNIGRERQTDFLIPLNLDGLKPTELDWMTNDLTFIPFYDNWHTGFIQLIKKLDSIGAPKRLGNAHFIAASTYNRPPLLHTDGEELLSNILPIVVYPKSVFLYRLKRTLASEEISLIARSFWAYYKTNPEQYLSFQRIPEGIELADSSIISSSDKKIAGLEGQNVISSLLYKSIWNKFKSLGCRQASNSQIIYFPAGVMPKNMIKFSSYNGRRTYVLVTGIRSSTISGEKVKYVFHLCPQFKIRQNGPCNFDLQITPRLYFTDLTGQPLNARSALSRRKKGR